MREGRYLNISNIKKRVIITYQGPNIYHHGAAVRCAMGIMQARECFKIEHGEFKRVMYEKDEAIVSFSQYLANNNGASVEIKVEISINGKDESCKSLENAICEEMYRLDIAFTLQQNQQY